MKIISLLMRRRNIIQVRNLSYVGSGNIFLDIFIFFSGLWKGGFYIVLRYQGRRKVWKSGGASSNRVGIIWETVTSFLGGVNELRTVKDMGEGGVKKPGNSGESFTDGPL